MNQMPETCDQPSRSPQALIGMAWLRSQRTCAQARLGLVLLVAGWSMLRSSAAGIQHTGNTFVCSGSSSVITINDTNGSIVAVTSAGQASNILAGGEYGLWSAKFKEGGSINAAAFNSSPSSSGFNWTLASSGNSLLLVYSNADLAVTVAVSNRDDGVDFVAQVQPRQKTVLEFELPGRLRFTPANLQRLICPLHSSDGVGAAFKPGFFQSQPEASPAGWTTVQAGEAGYISLFGGGLVSRAVNDPPVPLSFTASGRTWLGTNVVAAWNGANAIVNRPPATGQADVVLVDSTNGAYFSGSHLGGAGYLFRLGGLVDSARAPLAQDLVIAAVEHLAQTPPAGRTKVGLLNLIRGPANGGWAAVAVSDWLNRLRTSTALASAGIQVVELPAAQAMLDALASTNYLAILNQVLLGVC